MKLYWTPQKERGNANNILSSTSLTSQRKHCQTSSTLSNSTSTLSLNFLTDTRYLDTHSLNNADSVLLLRPKYKCCEDNRNEADSFDDDVLEILLHHTDDNLDDKNYLSDDDDIMTDEPSSDENCLSDKVCGPHHVINPPMFNTFMKHPHYNAQTRDYQRAMDEYVERSRKFLAQEVRGGEFEQIANTNQHHHCAHHQPWKSRRHCQDKCRC